MRFGVLQVKTPDGEIREYPLEQTSISIGRARNNEIVIEHDSISRRHARLTCEPDKLLIEDSGSVAGTYLDGRRVSSMTPSRVKEGQVIRLGEIELYYFPSTPEEPNAPPQPVKPSMTNLAPAVALGGPSVVVSLEGPQRAVVPDSLTTATITVQNRGLVRDDLTLQLAGLPEEWVRLSKKRVNLQPGAQVEVTLTLQPSKRSETTAGDHPFTVTVTSHEHRAKASVQGVLKVLPFQAVAAALQPARSRRKFQVQVHNQGNQSMTYRLRGSDEQRALDFQFAQAEIELSPGAQQTIELQVAPKVKIKAGTRGVYGFNVIATAEASSAQATGLLIIHRPLLWMWLSIVMLLLFGAALAYPKVCYQLSPDLPLCPPDPNPIVSVFTVTPQEIESGGVVALSWDVQNADEVKLTEPDQITLDKIGVRAFSVNRDTRFTLQATNASGTTERSIDVKVKSDSSLSAAPFVENAWNGHWETSYGGMDLVQSGQTITGTYANNGSVTGTVDGNHLSGKWSRGGQDGTLDWWIDAAGATWRGNYNQSTEWCGYRSSGKAPTPCRAP
jgi:pSer/pThr/pTyr-binding forkhead associated (FHA) protein